MICPDAEAADNKKLVRSIKHTLREACLGADANRMVSANLFDKLIFRPCTRVEIYFESLFTKYLYRALANILKQEDLDRISIELLQDTCVLLQHAVGHGTSPRTVRRNDWITWLCKRRISCREVLA